jgi:sulfonate transport system substrate-binding protein
VVEAILDELAQLGQWAEKHPHDATQFLAKETGLDTNVLALAVSRFSYGAKPVTPEVLAEQQRIADAFVTLKLIPKPIKVADAAWAPPAQQARR